MVTPLRQVEAKRRELRTKALKNPVDPFAPLQAWWHHEFNLIVEEVSPQLKAGKFDNALETEEHKQMDGGSLHLQLERLCAELPLCTNEATAKLVIAASKNGDKAEEEIHNGGNTTWTGLAAVVLAADLREEAERCGWHETPHKRIGAKGGR